MGFSGVVGEDEMFWIYFEFFGVCDDVVDCMIYLVDWCWVDGFGGMGVFDVYDGEVV